MGLDSVALFLLGFGFCFVRSAVKIWTGKLIDLDALKSAWIMVA